jgi:hypothetical protein
MFEKKKLQFTPHVDVKGKIYNFALGVFCIFWDASGVGRVQGHTQLILCMSLPAYYNLI